MIRSFWVALVAGVCTVVIGPLAIVGAHLGFPRGFFDRMGRTWCRCVLWAAATPVRISGLEHISLDHPQIIASNHQSMFDVFALTAFGPVRFHFLVKKELLRVPLWGQAVRSMGHVFIDRQNRASAVESLKAAGRKIRDEKSSAIVFPEGTRSLAGDLQPFKKGPFVMAIESGVPVVPTVVDGTLHILPKRGLRIRPHPITIWFGEPVDSRLYTHETRDALIVRVHAQMADMLAELRAKPGYSGPRRLTAESALVESEA